MYKRQSVKWPGIRVLYNADQFWCLAYPWPRVVPPPLQTRLRGPWMQQNILENHGPLLAAYYTWGDGRRLPGDPEHTHGDAQEARKYAFGKGDFISEGDSPAYFNLIDVGLRNAEDVSYGGWGGRLVRSANNPRRWEDGRHVTDFNPFTQKPDASFPQTRWLDALQNDFAARADWCVKPVAQANHPPKVTLAGPQDVTARRGQQVALRATAADPDGDAVALHWWHYVEAGTFPEKIEILAGTTPVFTVPETALPGQTFHLIAEATDGGSPALTRYGRLIVTIK